MSRRKSTIFREIADRFEELEEQEEQDAILKTATELAQHEVDEVDEPESEINVAQRVRAMMFESDWSEKLEHGQRLLNLRTSAKATCRRVFGLELQKVATTIEKSTAKVAGREPRTFPKLKGKELRAIDYYLEHPALFERQLSDPIPF